MTEKKEEKFDMMFEPSLKVKAQKLAQQRDRSLASLIRYLLKQEIKEEQ
jgi:hypothetical protein